MVMRSKVRFTGALAGMCLWFGYPFIFWSGGIAVHRYVCQREPAVDGRDPCFSDYIPILEMLAFVLTLALAYPFARFAFTLFAPDPDQRGRGWWFASRSTREDRFPMLQVIAALGFLWVAVNAQNYPAALYQYWLYWTAWIAWFAAGILFSWPHRAEKTA